MDIGRQEEIGDAFVHRASIAVFVPHDNSLDAWISDMLDFVIPVRLGSTFSNWTDRASSRGVRLEIRNALSYAQKTRRSMTVDEIASARVL